MSSSEVDELIDDLISRQVVSAADLHGCTQEEIAALLMDQGVTRLPDGYRSYLTRVGRGAGPLLLGSDAFYPGLLGLKGDAAELLAEAGIRPAPGPESFVIAMHQGYQAFWFPSVAQDEPEVVMYQEGDPGPLRTWPTFTAYLRSMISEVT